jgi:L-fuculose-phosphate aldolase
MPQEWHKERNELLAATQAMLERGLVSGTAGNASVRLPVGESSEQLFMITPASRPYESMTTADLVVVTEKLEPLDGESIPSTESLLHMAIYAARPDVAAIMHTHSIFATVAAVAGKPIPPIVDELVIYVGGAVEVSDYGEPGSEELAEAGVKALGDRRAVLLRNHGMCAVGTSPSDALAICTLVEKVAQIYLYADQAGGANLVPAEAIDRERAIYCLRNEIDI